MAYLRIVPYNDHDDAVLTPSATAATGFPTTETQNGIRSRVWRTTSAASQSLTGVVSANRTANHFSMWRHRAAGASVRFQLFSDAGATAQVYDSTALPLIWYTDSDPYIWSTGTNDPHIIESPYRVWFDPTVYRSYKITWSGTPTYYATYFQVSRIVVGLYLEFQWQPGFGVPLGFVSLTDRNRSLGGTLRTNVGGIYKTMNLDLIRIFDNERAALLKIKRQLGTGRDFVISLYPEDGTDLERDYMILGKFASVDPVVREESRYTSRLIVEET